jgi:hypothetical protein
MLLKLKRIDECIPLFKMAVESKDLHGMMEYIYFLKQFSESKDDLLFISLKILEKDPLNRLAFDELIQFVDNGQFEVNHFVKIICNGLLYSHNEPYLWNMLEKYCKDGPLEMNDLLRKISKNIDFQTKHGITEEKNLFEIKKRVIKKLK